MFIWPISTIYDRFADLEWDFVSEIGKNANFGLSARRIDHLCETFRLVWIGAVVLRSVHDESCSPDVYRPEKRGSRFKRRQTSACLRDSYGLYGSRRRRSGLVHERGEIEKSRYQDETCDGGRISGD